MKKATTIIALFISVIAWSQSTDQATSSFSVIGELKQEFEITLKAIEKGSSKPIDDVAIVNHKGKPRGIAKKLSGVLIKDLLKDLELQEDSPKLYSEFYLVFIANDGYKVVYSWNEIFNSPIGDQLYVITARDGKKLHEMKDSILILTPIDFKTGRRHIKNLKTIIVKRAD